MYENRSQSRDGGRGARDQGDDPPMSRLFIICNKAHTEEDFREAFSQFGDIEDIWVVKDKHTGESKGITYIKYAKTSQAARAQEEMNGKTIGSLDRTLKVLVAASRNQGSTKSDNEHEKYVRLFIVCPKTATEDELRDEFSQWGQVENVTLLRDKQSGNPKGFGYIRYSKFLDAAIALENCPAKYKPVFAEPKDSGRSLSSRDDNTMMGGRGGGGGGGGRGSGNMMKDNMGFGGPSNNFGAGMGGGGFNNMPSGGGSYNNWGNNVSSNKEMAQFLRLQNVPVPNPTCLEVIISNCVNQDQLWHLFNIIPGLNNCKILRECGPRTNEAIVVYDSPEAAIYARDKLHGLEYPAGERIIAKVSGMSSARIDTSFIDKRTKMDAVCNVPLPPVEPMAPADAQCAQRLFIVLTSNVPMSILKNVFSCWRGLMDVYLLPNKNCGYVKYANKNSAINAMQTLHGAEICGTRIKVLEAEERDHNNDDGDGNRKRMRRN